jgi:Fe-S-cluster containining protein
VIILFFLFDFAFSVHSSQLTVHRQVLTMDNLFEKYKQLVAKGDAAFETIERDYGSCIKCKPQCSDCCHAIFGLFLIEAAYVQEHFYRLDRKVRREILSNAEKYEKELQRVEERLQAHEDDPRMKSYALSKERVRCPLLNEDDECIIYPHRPITCRVYGIPTAIQGQARVCGKAAFERGESYPTFNLDACYKELYQLSKELLVQMGQSDMEKASLLISVAKVLKTPLEEIINEPSKEQSA